MNDNSNPNPNGKPIDWQLILKIAIAVLSAILGAIGASKVSAVSTFINGIM